MPEDDYILPINQVNVDVFSGQTLVVAGATGPQGPAGPTGPTGPAVATPGGYIATGLYISPQGVRTTAAFPAADVEYAVPFWIANSGTIVRIGISVTAVAGVTAGTLIRLGIRPDNGTGQPGTLLLDCGTVAGDAVASPEKTISLAVTPGLHWFTSTCQLAGATRPTVQMLSTAIYPIGNATLADVLGTAYVGYSSSAGITGALPSSYTVGGFSTAAPVIGLRG